MGADGFVVFYGIRHVIDDESEIALLEAREHPLQEIAKEHKLHVWWGTNYKTAKENSEGAYVLLGYKIGDFGLEGKLADCLSDESFSQLNTDVRAKLGAADFSESPSLLFQVDPDF